MQQILRLLQHNLLEKRDLMELLRGDTLRQFLYELGKWLFIGFRSLMYQLYYWTRRMRRWMSGATCDILVYPCVNPGISYLIKHVCLRRAYRIVENPSRPCDVAIYWKDATYREPDEAILKLAEARSVLNIRSRDISKDKVMDTFEEVFGYPFRIDPCTHTGPAFEKSDNNASHDGRLVECPIDEPLRGRIYQKWVDNQVNDELTEELRVTIFGGKICYVARHRMPLEQRIAGRDINWVPDPAEEVFSEDEILKILTFCKLLGLDISDLDISRDCHDGRIYILDANNTPTLPLPNRIAWFTNQQRMELLAQEFDNAFLAR